MLIIALYPAFRFLKYQMSNEHHYEVDIENWIWDMDRINADEFIKFDLSGDNYLETE